MPTAAKRYRPRTGRQRKPSDAAGGKRWYDLAIWRGRHGIRRRVLERDHYLCGRCGVPVGKSGHVDHRIPHRGRWELFVDEDNCVTLCHACHSRKTQAGG